MHAKLPFSALAAAISLSLAPAGPACADEPVQDAHRATLPPVVVTAQRLEQPVDQALASVTVLDRNAIEQSQAPDLASLLSRQAGVDLVRTGGPGSLSTINTRGSNSNHTLVLIDGLRVNSAVQGLYDLAHLPLAQIERIEIVRGPRAALWGSDAIGGVIQIFTRDNARPAVEARAGSYGRGGIDASWAGAAGANGRFRVGAGSERMDGFSATNPDAGPYAYDPDRDGYRNDHADAGYRRSLGSQELRLGVIVADARNEYDEGVSRVRNRELVASLSGALGRNWSQELVLGHSQNRVRSHQPFYDYGFASRRDSLDWLHRLSLPRDQTLQLGLNWSRETGRADDSFLGQNYDLGRRNTGVFLAWSGTEGRWQWETSLRHDDNSQFGGATTANAGAGWRLGGNLKLRASWGQGFRAPNFNELYYPGYSGYYAGNPDLAPERSSSRELGLEWHRDERQRLTLSLYRTQVKDLVAFEGQPFLTAINIDRARLDGAELDYRWQRGAWTVAANAGWQRAENAGTGEALLRRAPRKAHASVDYRLDNGVGLGLDLDAVSARPDLDFNLYPAARIALGGYGLVHARAAWPLAPAWTLEARVENLGNHRYALAQGFNTPGRSGVLSLRWSGD